MPLSDRAITVSYHRVAALASGLMGGMIAIAGAICYLLDRADLGNALTVITVPMVAGAGVLWVRSFCVALNDNWTAAFELGREVGREEAEIVREVTRLH